MFVSTTRLGEIQNNYIFYDKSLPMGNESERFVDPFLERVVNPKGKLAYKYFSIMTTGKKFVSDGHAPNDTTCSIPSHIKESLIKTIENFYTSFQPSDIIEVNNQLLNTFLESTLNDESFCKKAIQDTVFMLSVQNAFISLLGELYRDIAKSQYKNIA